MQSVFEVEYLLFSSQDVPRCLQLPFELSYFDRVTQLYLMYWEALIVLGKISVAKCTAKKPFLAYWEMYWDVFKEK